MNNKSNNKAIFISSMCLMIILVTFNHCVIDQKVNKRKTSSVSQDSSSQSVGDNEYNDDIIYGEFVDEPDHGGDTTEPTVETVTEEVHVGVRNFEEIYYSFSILTGVPYTNNTVRNTYNDVKVSLPTDNNIKTFSGANQLALVKLAGSYCDELIKSSTYRGAIFPNVNFSDNPTVAFTVNKRDVLIDTMITKFWKVEVRNMYQYNMERNEMNLLIDELLVGASESATTTQTTIKGLCTAVLSSSHTILL